MSNQPSSQIYGIQFPGWYSTPLGRHPYALPLDVPVDIPVMTDNSPDALSETWRWERWLEKICRPILQDFPDSNWAKALVAQAEEALAFRAALPPDQVFWRPDRRGEETTAAGGASGS